MGEKNIRKLTLHVQVTHQQFILIGSDWKEDEKTSFSIRMILFWTADCFCLYFFKSMF